MDAQSAPDHGPARRSPIVPLSLTVWGLWTASLRPLSGDSVWELVERAGNYGVPLLLCSSSAPHAACVDGPARVEIVLAAAVLLAPLPCQLIGLCRWKMATETLLLTAGALPCEWIERAGSDTAPWRCSISVTMTKGRATSRHAPAHSHTLPDTATASTPARTLGVPYHGMFVEMPWCARPRCVALSSGCHTGRDSSTKRTIMDHTRTKRVDASGPACI